jgi:KUP system potassium uptake protein
VPDSSNVADVTGQGPGHEIFSSKENRWKLALGALGVVYGDIGTSPLYALRECFNGPHAIPLSNNSIFGILSVVFWVLIIIISIKYMIFVLRADNHGEGGILALTALACPKRLREHSVFLLGLGVFGAALLYGDGVITPAISVLSAVEGLELATPVFRPFVIPITIGILIGLFTVQKHGTDRIGAIFGPVMLVWFFVIGILGVGGIIANPSIMKAFNPIYALEFFAHHQLQAYFVMGSLFLVVTGGEALYADIGHFGKKPVQHAWFAIVLPGLILNYFGQGALLLNHPEMTKNPFYLLAPNSLLYPLVGLSTIATVIASQALISGVFSLTSQAINLGFSPRLQIIQTSSREIGQVYLPLMNWALLVGTILLVLIFESSSGLAAAYGVSVSATMVITTTLLFFVARRVWKWRLWTALVLLSGFLIVDLIFLSANVIKIGQGGYVPLLIGLVIFICMMTWRKGKQILSDRLRDSSQSLQAFLRQAFSGKLARVPGVAVFMVHDLDMAPPALIHNVKHNKVIHEIVIILSIRITEVPSVSQRERIELKLVDTDIVALGGKEQSIIQAIARYGFMDSPDIVEVIELLKDRGLPIELDQATFFLARNTLIATHRADIPGMMRWREHLFTFMARNAERATDFFHIPPSQAIEVGIQVEI